MCDLQRGSDGPRLIEHRDQRIHTSTQAGRKAGRQTGRHRGRETPHPVAAGKYIPKMVKAVWVPAPDGAS